ncbi:SDR family NAD(P)-dependent oxidoreductase [Humibacter ginsenosidimutans]|uniref:SDR family oxidoreductase n=1 Tax=Humibacter ginsenosidimutans TaxID=2599293 RepID=A0A5B8M3U4_9MICO|nr:SDR family NAD(P)-dependent oxidoreductase [Humibacter ginsenosidimutans]QDZ14629.1 SDR family oxidoreductase [Humibacter ginsenosidimutans]
MVGTRTVLITGGAGGIGRFLAEAFRSAGDTVVLADLPSSRLTEVGEELGVATVPLDITDQQAVAAAVEAVQAEHGPIGALVNNAGILHLHGDVLSLPVADYETTIRVNILGTFTVTQAVAKAMIASGTRGAVVNISSIGGRQPTPGMGAYETSKAAVDAQTRWAAIELAAHGIRVNAVAPGPVDTPMMKMGMPEGSPMREAWLSRIPLKQMADPAQVASAAVFLASDGAADITGVSLPVDGGQLLA